MSEVQAALDRAMLETGVAVITPEMALGDVWERYKAIKAKREAELEMYAEVFETLPLDRVPSARGYRVRLYLDSVHGPIWLEWLGALAETFGVLRMQT